MVLSLARRLDPFWRRATVCATKGWRWAPPPALQLVLFAIGGACVAWWAAGTLSSALASARAGRRLERMITADTLVASHKGVDRSAAAVHIGDPLGWVAIPRIGVKTVIVEGDDDLTLAFAAGHIPGTALPGAGGNVALAGHRDGVFSRLERVRTGDLIRVTTPAATYRYAVVSTRVVQPEDVGILEPGSQPTLTLITCYPFSYVGPAPERFIVRARLLPSSSGPRVAHHVGVAEHHSA